MLLERLKMQFNNSLIEEIFFNQVLPNLKNGSIEIPIYNTNSNGDVFTFNVLVDAYDETSPYYLCIQDKEKLVNSLDEYMKIMHSNDSSINKQNIYDKIKYYLTLLWVNATYEDLRNPVRFIQKYIDFNNNPLFEDEFTYASNIEFLNDADIDVIIKREPANMETPYSFNAQINLFDNGKENNYYLPSICYGISGDICYIYSIQNSGMFASNPEFEKKIKRLLYKMNENVSSHESEDFKEYKRLEKQGNNMEDEFYPENISDVSVSAILALTVFMDSLNDMGIKNIKVVPFLPIRYKNRKSEYEKKYQLKLKQLKVDEIKELKQLKVDEIKELKQLKVDEIKELKQNLEEKRLLIQSNLTNKFIRDFMRLKHHFNGIDILSYPMEVDEYLSININNMECHNNKLIENILSNKVQDDYTL